ncbi:MAG: hypothetical protein NVSMB63_04540 [Sediminibacterium sp.]
MNAGRDTAVVANQLLQLNAVAPGASRFLWSPLTGLNDPRIANPVAQLGTDIDSISYLVRASDINGCYGEDGITVRIYRSAPEIFVPTAFTPNGDGRNDVLKPITAGISQLRYFRIYSRWGQLVFQTTELNKGWDGSLNGVKQPGNTYVYETEGVDYQGRIVFRKGTCVLIR